MFLTSPDKTLDVSFSVSHGESSYMVYASMDIVLNVEKPDTNV